MMLASILCILVVQCGMANALNVMIVYAHQEPQSFCAALKDVCVKTLQEAGHNVNVTDIYKLKMFNRIAMADFVNPVSPDYFLPQKEQAYANAHDRTNFIEELRQAHDTAEWAQLFLFVYPYYLSYMPGVLQSWLERAFSYGFAFGDGGDKLKGKRAMLIYTTGGPKEYIQDQEQKMIFLMHDRIKFWGMTALPTFPAYAAARVTDEIRQEYLANLTAIIKNIAPADQITY
jgi:NAD(P)H dehydrogenase (quinone)